MGGGKLDILDSLMDHHNEDGQNIIELAFFQLFAEGREDFLFFILDHLPNVSKYLYCLDINGWLPVFRVLHLFQKQIYTSERTIR